MIAVDNVVRTSTPRSDAFPTGTTTGGSHRLPPQLATLLDGVRHAPSLVAQGAMLRALDGATGSRTASDALVRGEAAPGQTAAGKPAAAKAPTYTDTSLYAGQPRADDIRQDALGDCYFVATLGAVAQQRPQAIRDAISYDAKTGTFNVRLYDAAGKAKTINVTQAEVADNVKRQGGSTMDNTGATSPAGGHGGGLRQDARQQARRRAGRGL